MIRFLLRRAIATIPTLIGISLVTFVVLNLTIKPRSLGRGKGVESYNLRVGVDDRDHMYGYHLPLFFNFSIEDARIFAENEITKLADGRTAPQAKRALIRAGGAWLPYLIPALPHMTLEQQERALDVLDEIAPKIDADRHKQHATSRLAFWKQYWDTYSSDFKPVRAARLVRRLVRKPDSLAVSELRHLDTYCLPQLMEALKTDITPDAQARVTELAGELAGINDTLNPRSSAQVREAVLYRWEEWWEARYDRYTVFEGLSRVTGTITQTRYFRWFTRMLTFDFGVSTRDGRPVLSKLALRLPVTILLSVLALMLAYLAAIPIGVVSAVRRGGIFDRMMMVGVFVLYSVPVFWMAILLLGFFAGSDYFDLFPSQGLYSAQASAWPLWRKIVDVAHHLVLPVFCLSFVPMAMLARYQRVGMLDVIDRDFMRTARAKGLSYTQAIIKHGFRNGIIPVITILGLQIPYLVSGSVVVERIFGIPGMGLETFEAIRAHDQPWLMAVVTVTAVMTMVGVVAADAIYAVIDPRIAPGGRQEGGQ